MKIMCNKNTLLDYVNIVSKAVSGRTTLPILECILLIADEDGFRLIANDLELGIETKQIESDILDEGSIALNARIFMDIIRRLPGDTVSIESNAQNIAIIKSNKAEFKILGLPGDEFPFLTRVDRNNEFSIPSFEFKNMIKQTIFSVSTDETKMTMTGENFKIEGDTLKLASVDGYRISLRILNINNENPLNQNIDIIIPAKSLNELNKILPSSEDSQTLVYITDKNVLFELDDCIIVSRLIEGKFFNYNDVFTDDVKTLITVVRETLLDSLERASLISRDAKKNPVKLNIANDLIIITSNTEAGASYDEIPVELDGTDIEIAFNPKFLIDALKAIETENITMQFTSPISPCIIKGEQSEAGKYLVVPLRAI